jgi:hypothetical protein
MFMATAPPLDAPTLGDPDRLGEILVMQLGVDDLVAVLGQVGWFNAARNRLPAV